MFNFLLEPRWKPALVLALIVLIQGASLTIRVRSYSSQVRSYSSNENVNVEIVEKLSANETEPLDQLLVETSMIRHLSSGGLAHLKETRKGVNAVLLVPKRVRKAIVERLGPKNKHARTKFIFPSDANQAAASPTCKFCPFNGECIDGFYFVSWGAEEDMWHDFGQTTQSRKFLAETNSTLSFLGKDGAHPGMFTMVIDCDLQEAAPKDSGGIFTISVDGWMTEASEFNFAEGLIESPPPSKIKQVNFEVYKPFSENIVKKTKVFERPVVCGRQLFGSLDARYIDRIVRMNKNQGVAATIMYEMGNSQVYNLDAISEHLENGDLILVDARSELQNFYGYLGPIVTENAKAAGQWLTRLDCLFRLKQLKPSWIVYSDMDEYPVPGPNSTAMTTLEDTLKGVREKSDVVMFSVIAGDDQFCTNVNATWDWGDYITLTQSMDRKVQLGESKKRRPYSPKYAIRPTTSTLGLRIHYVFGRSYHRSIVPQEEFYFSHNRCVANLKFPSRRGKRKPK